jgi:hypothetical protein
MVGSLGVARLRVHRGDGVHSVMSSLDAAIAQRSIALSLLDEEAAYISSDEHIPLHWSSSNYGSWYCRGLRPAGGRFAELHLQGTCAIDR